jgi:hypothetical protein
MLRSSLIFIFLIGAFWLQGQTKPNFFPEDINLNTDEVELRCFCEPGVRYKSRTKGLEVTYGTMTNSVFEPEEPTVLTQPYSSFENQQQFKFDLKFPLINRDQFKLFMGYRYFSEFYQFDQIGVDFTETFTMLDQRNLKSNSVTAIMIKPINETQYLVGRLAYSSNGNYQGWMNWDGKYGIFNALAAFTVKPNDFLEWGVGVNVSSSFRRTSFIPIVILNRTFNERWGLEAILPGFVFGRYNINTYNILLFGIEYDSRSYRMEVSNTGSTPFDYAFNRSAFQSSVRLEHRFAPWVWGNFKLGYQINFSSDFEATSAPTPGFLVEPTNSLFVNVGLFLSPPR